MTLEAKQDHLSLKWGTLKAWDVHSEAGIAALRRYKATLQELSAMAQNDTPEQTELLCQLIDACNAQTIHLEWDGIDVSKEDAKRYVREYRT